MRISEKTENSYIRRFCFAFLGFCILPPVPPAAGPHWRSEKRKKCVANLLLKCGPYGSKTKIKNVNSERPRSEASRGTQSRLFGGPDSHGVISRRSAIKSPSF